MQPTLALRLGAKEVYMVYRRSEREMPAFQFEYENAKLEGACNSAFKRSQ